MVDVELKWRGDPGLVEGGPVFIFGAGSSAAAKAPVTATFQDAARRTLQGFEKASRARNSFASALQLWDELAPKSNIEEFYVLVDLLARTEANVSWDTRVEELKFLIAKTIESSIEGGRNLDKHRRLIRNLITCHYGLTASGGRPVNTRKPTLISLNWYVLLDAAVDREGHGIQYGLGETSTGPLSIGGDRAFQFTLLKLHGSLNWWLCPLCSDLQVQHPSHAAALYWEKGAQGARPCKTCNGSMQPLFVPPTSQKLAAVHDHFEPFPELWSRARRSLLRCREVYFVGYSFPPADLQFRVMVAEALRSNPYLQRIIVITKPKFGLERTNFEESYLRALRGTGQDSKLEFRYQAFEDWVQQEPSVNPPDSKFGTRVLDEPIFTLKS
jgi:hypothetical protein